MHQFDNENLPGAFDGIFSEIEIAYALSSSEVTWHHTHVLHMEAGSYVYIDRDERNK